MRLLQQAHQRMAGQYAEVVRHHHAQRADRDEGERDEVWNAVYAQACIELHDAMDLAYLTAQRPSDVLIARAPGIDGDLLSTSQGKTSKKLRIRLINAGGKTDLGILIDRRRQQRKDRHIVGRYLVTTPNGRRPTASMSRIRFDEAREAAARAALENRDKTLATAVRQFQFRAIRPKAASEIDDLGRASKRLVHTDRRITETVHRRVGEVVDPTRWTNVTENGLKVTEINRWQSRCHEPQAETRKPRRAGLSACSNWRKRSPPAVSPRTSLDIQQPFDNKGISPFNRPIASCSVWQNPAIRRG